MKTPRPSWVRLLACLLAFGLPCGRATEEASSLKVDLGRDRAVVRIPGQGDGLHFVVIPVSAVMRDQFLKVKFQIMVGNGFTEDVFVRAIDSAEVAIADLKTDAVEGDWKILGGCQRQFANDGLLASGGTVHHEGDARISR